MLNFFPNLISSFRFRDIQIIISDVSKILYISCLKIRFIQKLEAKIKNRAQSDCYKFF
jgi:hypothetical protein